MVFIEKAVFLIGGSIGLLVFVNFFDAFFVTTAGTVSKTTLSLLQLIPFVLGAVLVFVLLPKQREERTNVRNI